MTIKYIHEPDIIISEKMSEQHGFTSRQNAIEDALTGVDYVKKQFKDTQFNDVFSQYKIFFG